MSERFQSMVEDEKWVAVRGGEDPTERTVAIAAAQDYRAKIAGPPAVVRVKVWGSESSPAISEWKITFFVRSDAERIE